MLTEQEAGQSSRDPHTPEHFPNDVSADELTTNVVPPDTEVLKAARRLRNTKHAERRQHLTVNLPIRNLNDTLAAVAQHPHDTPEAYIASLNVIG